MDDTRILILFHNYSLITILHSCGLLILSKLALAHLSGAMGIKFRVAIGFFIIFFVSLNSNANLIHNIKLTDSENIPLLNNKEEIQDSLYEYLARSTLDVHAYAKRLVLESKCE